MNYAEWCEENDAWFSRNDRFDGWGDPDRAEDAQPAKRVPMPAHWVDEDIPF